LDRLEWLPKIVSCYRQQDGLKVRRLLRVCLGRQTTSGELLRRPRHATSAAALQLFDEPLCFAHDAVRSEKVDYLVESLARSLDISEFNFVK
jgi:hypothetical protein